MTRKDYQAIARAIAKVRADRQAPNGGLLPLEVRHTLEEVEDALAEVFARDNERFIKDKFVQACKA